MLHQQVSRHSNLRNSFQTLQRTRNRFHRLSVTSHYQLTRSVAGQPIYTCSDRHRWHRAQWCAPSVVVESRSDARGVHVNNSTKRTVQCVRPAHCIPLRLHGTRLMVAFRILYSIIYGANCSCRIHLDGVIHITSPSPPARPTAVNRRRPNIQLQRRRAFDRTSTVIIGIQRLSVTAAATDLVERVSQTFKFGAVDAVLL